MTISGSTSVPDTSFVSSAAATPQLTSMAAPRFASCRAARRALSAPMPDKSNCEPPGSVARPRECTRANERASPGRAATMPSGMVTVSILVGTCRLALVQVAIPGQRPEREVMRVAVIFQIEDPREAGGGMFRIVPETVFALGIHDPPGATGECCRTLLSGGHQPQHGPGRLETGGHIGAAAWRIPVIAVILAPASVTALLALEKGHRPLDPVLTHVFTQRFQSHQNRPRAIDVVRAPAPEPGTIVFLLAS